MLGVLPSLLVKVRSGRFEFHNLACSQIWLNLLMDDYHFGYIINKSDPKKKTF
jgi:hypothetical protein